jgi:hypothetical protein
LRRPLRISWASFQLSFGAGYAETPQGKSRFRGNAIEALRRVKAVYAKRGRAHITKTGNTAKVIWSMLDKKKPVQEEDDVHDHRSNDGRVLVV